MNAAVFNPYWDSLGGGERYTAAFAKLLLNRGWRVDIIWPKNIAPQILDHFGIDISAANFVPHYTLFAVRYSLLFWLSDGSLPFSLARKTIVHLQFPFHHVGGRNLPNLIKSRFYTFVANSQFTKDKVDSEYSINCRVIYPPIDVNQFTPSRKTNTILYIGRFSHLTQQKNHSLLIEAFRSLHSRLPGWKLILAGGTTVGTNARNLSHLKAQARGLPVEIITNPTFSKIRDLCARAKIFWSASGYSAGSAPSPIKSEHFGITVVEAMATGAVPIISNLGGHREIVVPGESGFLWDNPSELQSFTVRLVSDPDLLARLSSQTVSRSKMFDISRFNDQFAQLL